MYAEDTSITMRESCLTSDHVPNVSPMSGRSEVKSETPKSHTDLLLFSSSSSCFNFFLYHLQEVCMQYFEYKENDSTPKHKEELKKNKTDHAIDTGIVVLLALIYSLNEVYILKNIMHLGQ